MGLKHYIEEHKDNLTEEKLYKIAKVFAKVIDNHVPDHIDKMERKVHCLISDGHYNEEFALEDVKHMYYVQNGNKVFAPYWDMNKVSKIYDSFKGNNPILDTYNLYDFYVTLNMIKSDNYKLYKSRFKNYSENELDNLFVEDAINWLDDSDNPFGESKIWEYINSHERKNK